VIWPARGAFALMSVAALLGGCVAPMTTREAQTIASSRLNKYCRGRCGTVTMARTQKIKDRWLVDFEAPQEKFTVIVENDGNSKVTVWSK
jgi:very-short-patch-repair endonuclease